MCDKHTVAFACGSIPPVLSNTHLWQDFTLRTEALFWIQLLPSPILIPPLAGFRETIIWAPPPSLYLLAPLHADPLYPHHASSLAPILFFLLFLSSPFPPLPAFPSFSFSCCLDERLFKSMAGSFDSHFARHNMMWQCQLSQPDCRCYRVDGYSLLKRLPLHPLIGPRCPLQSVGQWLDSIGLVQYENHLLANGFDNVQFMVSVFTSVLGERRQEEILLLGVQDRVICFFYFIICCFFFHLYVLLNCVMSLFVQPPSELFLLCSLASLIIFFAVISVTICFCSFL